MADADIRQSGNGVVVRDGATLIDPNVGEINFDANLTATQVSVGRVEVDATSGGGAPTGPAGGDLAGEYPDPTVAQASGAWARTGVISPSAVSGALDDYNPTGLSTASVIRLDLSGPATLQSLAGGAAGRILTIHNISTTAANTLTISHEAGTTAANRISTPSTTSIVVPMRGYVMLQYDSTTSRWRVASGAYLATTVRETGGPTNLAIGAVSDLGILARSGTSVVSPAGFTSSSGGQLRIIDHQLFASQASDPAPAASDSLVYFRTAVGRSFPRWVEANGAYTLFQPAIASRGMFYIKPNNSTTQPLAIGHTAVSGIAGTFSHPTCAAGSLHSSLHKTRCTSGTGANANAGFTHTQACLWRGDAAGLGGFFIVCRMAMNTNVTGHRMFVGISNATVALCGVNPTQSNNACGVGYEDSDSSSGNLQFFHNDGTAPGVKVDAGASFPRSAMTDNVFDIVISCLPNDSAIRVAIFRPDTGAYSEQTFTTEIPAATTFLRAHFSCGAGATGVAAAADMVWIYVETDMLA